MLFDGYGGNTGLGGAWSMDGTVSIGGTSYNVYNHSTTQAQVLVKSTVSTVNMLTSPIMLDLNQGGDRKVTNVSEYAFTQYGGKTDLEGLRAGFDSNGDGVLDANDARFGEFAVWQDANGNGVSDAGEVKTLADLGITSINLTSDGKTDASQADMLVHGTTTQNGHPKRPHVQRVPALGRPDAAGADRPAHRAKQRACVVTVAARKPHVGAEAPTYEPRRSALM